ncbi:MAG: stalk domain-containing protein [Oscillospiraceae bacterium]
MKKRGLITALCAALLIFTLPFSGRVSASSPYFVAVNDSLLELGVYTPISSGGLYVPGSVYNEGLGVNYFYSGTLNSVTVFSGNSRLVFDLGAATCYDGDGVKLTGSAISRDGKVYLPLDLVCNYFGLTYSYLKTDFGPLLRIKSGAAVLSDQAFVSAARNMMKSRYEEWTGITVTDPPAASPTRPTGGTQRPTPTPTAQPRTLSLRVCVKGPLGPAAEDFLDYLESRQASAVFFTDAQSVLDNPGLVRQIYARGHLIGTDAETHDGAEEFNDALDGVLMTRSRLALSESLAEYGYVYVPVNVYGGALDAGSLMTELEPYINGLTANLLLDNNESDLDSLKSLMRSLGSGGRIADFD